MNQLWLFNHIIVRFKPRFYFHAATNWQHLPTGADKHLSILSLASKFWNNGSPAGDHRTSVTKSNPDFLILVVVFLDLHI